MSTATAPAAGYASASLYVGDLNAEITEALLFEIFNAVGPVASVRVCRDAATRRSLGYAYVNFHRAEDAERALDTMNFEPIKGRACRIMWSHRDPTLRKSGAGNIFVKNLAPSIDNKTLYDTFSMFGNILSCKVAINSKRESLGYGFVHYENEEAAKQAIERVNGMVIANQKVQVTQFKSLRERGGPDKSRFTNVYAKNLPEEMTKEQMDEMFGKFGKITSSFMSVGADGKSKGFGFINFDSAEEAQAAINALDKSEVGGKKLYVSRAQKKEEREKELRDQFEKLKLEKQKQYAGVNLYVKNLADTIDENKLREEFAKFGDITSAKIMLDGPKTRGFGFICYATPEEATRAVTEMNGKMLDGKPLYVALAQRKEVRRAHLEAQYAARSKMAMAQPGMYPPQGPAMFYPPQGMPQRVMYPQQMGMPRRWNPQAQRQPAPQMMGHPMYMGGMPGQPAGAPQAVNGRPPQQGGPRAGGRQRPPQQGGAPGGKGPKGQDGMEGNRQRNNQNFKYTAQVRNRDAAMSQQGSAPAPASGMAQPAGMTQQPLTIQALAAAPEEQQKQMIGERLFPLIQAQEPHLAGKITGMLLEMDNGELLHLLESNEARTEKIQEALQVLHQHSQEGTEETRA